VITVLTEGSTVKLNGAATNGWQPVICGGKNGYVSSAYVTLVAVGPGGWATAGMPIEDIRRSEAA
jgi:uncharacterized protein YgiM (DUF1202 family)